MSTFKAVEKWPRKDDVLDHVFPFSLLNAVRPQRWLQGCL